MSTLPSNPNDTQIPPTRIELVPAGRRSHARQPLAQDVMQPSQEHEQCRSDDQPSASVGPTTSEGRLTVSASEVPHACALDNSNFFTRNVEPRPEVIAGLIREGQLGVLAGTYGVGKSPCLRISKFAHSMELPGAGARFKGDQSLASTSRVLARLTGGIS